MQNPNWQPVFFDFLVAGAIILVIFRLLGYLLPLLVSRKKGKPVISRIMPVAEAAIWVIYLSWYSFRFAEIRSVYAFVVIGILLVIFFWASRYLLRELIAGIIFRVSGRFRPGEVIVHRKNRGTIKEFRTLSLEVETPDGQSVFIPYSKLAASISIKQESADQAAAYNFSFTMDTGMSREETAERLQQYLVALPWSSVERTPVVTLREEGKNTFRAEITAYPMEKAFGKKIERHTTDTFASGEGQN